MIYKLMRAITQLEFHLVSAGARRKHGEASGDGHIAQARFQPPHTVRADRLGAPGVLKPSREQSVEIRPGNGMTDEGRPDIWPGVEDRTDGPERVQPRVLPGPLNSVLANQQFNICLGFVQECRRFKSALPGPDHHDSLSAKDAQVQLLRGMRSQALGESSELRGSHRKRSDPSSDDDAAASYNFPIRQYHAEARCALFDFGNLSLLQVGNGTRLKPATVSYEACDWDGPTHTHAGCSLKCVDR
jgi:hypothetical protein